MTEYPEIIVMGRDALRNYVETRPHVVIAVHDPTAPIHDIKDNPARTAEIQLAFWDLDRRWENIPEGYFSEEQAEVILRFVDHHRDAKAIICACEAGISRSAAVAAAVSKIITDRDEHFFRRYLPNRRVYSMILARHFKRMDNHE